MLSVKYSHDQYQDFVHSLLTKFYLDTQQQVTLLTNFPYIAKLWNTNLSGIVPLIRPYYSSSTQGAPPKDAVAMLRSLVLMAFKGVTSISDWVNTLRSEPFFAILSGFIPACLGSSRIVGLAADPIPGVGTFYDFMDRLIRKDRALHKSNLRRFCRKPKSKQKKHQKMNSPSTTLTERLVNRVIKYSSVKLPDSIEASLNLILKELFVRPSLERGLLGNPKKFNTAGDGTCMPTHASPYGKKVCDCVLKPGEGCKCKRKFTDPSASWGWDSYNERYFYGHSFHVFTAADSFYSLPIHIKCVTGERHDSITGIFALKELVDLYPELLFHSAAFDAGYDSAHFYLLNHFYNINPVIALNGRNSAPASNDTLITFDDYGIPHGAKCGHKLRNWGLMQKSFRRKWLFPAQCDSCQKCEASSNKTFYTPTSDNPRFFGSILRNTKQWRKLYKRRTTTERFNDRLKHDFKVKEAVIYSGERRIVRTFIAAFCCYIDAWINEKPLEITDIFPSISKRIA